MAEHRPKQLSHKSRLFLLLLSEANLILGTLFFVYPSLMIEFWPWPVKALAVRFIGAIFLAITLGCWSALRARGWQRAKILPLVGGTFYGLTSVITVSWAFSPNPGATVWAWAAFFVVAALGLVAILVKHGWRREKRDWQITTGQPWKMAKVFFRIQTVVVGLFGTMMILFPDVAQQQFWPWRVQVPTLQTFGALFVATCIATGWASQQADIRRLRVVLPLDAVFPALALLAVGVHWNTIVMESPSWLVTGVWVFLYSFVASGSAYLYIKSEKKKTNY